MVFYILVAVKEIKMNAKSVYNMLVRKGIDATVRVYPSSSFDPDTNRTTLGEATDYSVKIVPPYRNREGYKPAELITHGKGLTGIANYDLSFSVVVGLKITVNSKEWTVTEVTPIQDNTGILFYTLKIEAGD